MAHCNRRLIRSRIGLAILYHRDTMFGDGEYFNKHLAEQEKYFAMFIDNAAAAKHKISIVESDSGTVVPTVRTESEYIC
jgi:hypothetical protein